MKSEKQGHFVFYGAMVAEGIIALIWAAAGCALYNVTGGLNTGLAAVLADGQSAAIYDVCSKTMGGVGIALAMIGVIVCPITSGDTAFLSEQAEALYTCTWCRSSARYRKCDRRDRLYSYMALFQLDESDISYDRSVGSFDVSGNGKEELLDHSSACNIHECGFMYILHTRAGVSGRHNQFQDS